MGALSIFPGVGKLGVWRRKSPAGARDGAPVGVREEAPKADNRL